MKKLLNTLYVTTPDAYLSLDGENVVVSVKSEEKLRVPLHNLREYRDLRLAGGEPGADAARDRDRYRARVLLTER